MGEAVDNSLRFLTAGDVHDMIACLKSVPPVADASNPAAVRIPLEPPHPLPLEMNARGGTVGIIVPGAHRIARHYLTQDGCRPGWVPVDWLCRLI
jgi:hypothetical protein